MFIASLSVATKGASKANDHQLTNGELAAEPYKETLCNNKKLYCTCNGMSEHERQVMEIEMGRISCDPVYMSCAEQAKSVHSTYWGSGLEGARAHTHTHPN